MTKYYSPSSAAPATSVSFSSNNNINALLFDDPTKWGGPLGTGATITYSFPSGQAGWQNGYGAEVNGSMSSFTAQQMQATRFALSLWSDVANLDFIEVADTAQSVGTMRFTFTSAIDSWWGWAYGPNDYWASGGDVWVNPKYRTVDWTIGTHDLSALVHEIGHALGLGHPHEDTYRLPANLDYDHFTVMSYASQEDVWSWNASTREYSYGTYMPMVYDIQAIQYLYGANMSHRTGNDTYSFDPSQPMFEAIWDAGGHDTIDVSSFSNASRIDLRAGAYSTLGYNSWDAVDNLGIAFGVTIEQAIGGRGNDTITGNAANNVLRGNGGNDVIDGGAGSDTAAYSGRRADYSIDATGTSLTVRDRVGGRDGTDTLTSIEKIVFSDVAYNLGIAAKAASLPLAALNGILDLYIAYFNRVPEADGLGYWIDQYKSGMSLQAIAKQFYADAITLGDITGYSHDMPLRDYIVMSYQNVLGRTGDLVSAADVDWWVAEISSGRASRDNLPSRFIADSRIVANDPANAEQWGWMADYLDNRTELGLLHAVTFGVDYLSQQDAHTRTVAITKLVTSEGISDALSLIGLSSNNYL